MSHAHVDQLNVTHSDFHYFFLNIFRGKCKHLISMRIVFQISYIHSTISINNYYEALEFVLEHNYHLFPRSI